MPQVFGIMAVVLSVWGVLFSLFQILNASNELSLISDSGGENTIITIWTYTEPIIRIIVSIVFGYAGVELYNYKKRAIFIGLGAISINVVSGLIASYVNSIAYGQTINVQWGQIFGGIGVFFTFFCNTCCGLLMVLPLLISPQDLE
jgi:heme/copper-type cytochrome/quinol oxidase subunit 2